MSAAPATPGPVKLVVGMLAGRREVLAEAAERLEGNFGPADIVSEVWDFDSTDYYAEQMGEKLLRQFVAFDTLIPPDALARIKLATNAMEAEFAARSTGVSPVVSRSTGVSPVVSPPIARPLNLDPGYITEANLVLASCKGFAHRIYLDGGVYAEVTLTYHSDGWQGCPHTFPDYASGKYDRFFTEARTALRRQLALKEARR